MVNRYAQIDNFADWERFLERGQNLLLIHERFTQIERLVLTADVPAAAAALRDLVEEVYDLVEAHLPEVDVNRLRAIFRWQRTAWDALPPGALAAD